MFLFCCDGAQPLSPDLKAETCDEEHGGTCFSATTDGGAYLPATIERIEKERFPNPAKFKRCPSNNNSTEIIEEYVEVVHWGESGAEDSGSVSSASVGSGERKESFHSRTETNEDEWSPDLLAFYYEVLNAVGKALKRTCIDMEVDTIYCICHPTCIKEYVRCLIYTEATPECFIIALLYLERFLERNTHIPMTSSNVQLLYLTALTVAIKYVDDIYFNSAFYSKIGGVGDVRTLNRLELKFLFGLNFNLMVDREQYHETERALLGAKMRTTRWRTNSRETKRRLNVALFT